MHQIKFMSLEFLLEWALFLVFAEPPFYTQFNFFSPFVFYLSWPHADQLELSVRPAGNVSKLVGSRSKMFNLSL